MVAAKKEKSHCFSAGWFLLGIFLSMRLSAQEDSIRMVRDSIRVPIENGLSPVTPEFLPFASEVEPSASSVLARPTDTLLRFLPETPFIFPYYAPLQPGDYAAEGLLWQARDGGMLSGAGSQTALPGIGRRNEAWLTYQQPLGERWEIQASVGAMKMYAVPAIGQAFNASAALRYFLSERIALKAFGSYAAGHTYGTPTGIYGATLSADLSDRFGVEVGVRRYYDPSRGGWQTAPIVSPYYRFDKVRMELDVGGILYELLHRAVFKSSNVPGRTIAPPHFQGP